jgi:hypothetical protein
MTGHTQIVALALFGLLCVPLRAEEPAATNAYRLIFKDTDGVTLAEAKFITPEFTIKKPGPLDVSAEIHLVDNASAKEGARWLKRLLKTGKKVPARITTGFYTTNKGDVVAETYINFNPDAADANITARYINNPIIKVRTWDYDIFAGGFIGGNVVFTRVRIPAPAGAVSSGPRTR